MFLIPIISSILYLAGGQGFKAARWIIGIPIFYIAIKTGHSWYSIFAIVTYLIATNVFSYGENMWTTKLFGKWASMILSGITLGLASTPILGWTWGIAQAIIGGVSFGVLKWLDEKEILKNPWQELCRGLLGTIIYVIM